ncbi:MAG: hypothetical protein A2Z20_10220 [Bdellovibrionales bacterium RBG_16_40_8]|nr:MAG: hypothetical protein A2Z20_10220 [Bdellovibrionales bacterium RBG_16_40_8]
MEKISGILPPKARITSVDMKGSGAARSGTPSFGREVGMSSVERRMLQDTAAKANFAHQDQMSLRSTVKDPKAEIVQRMADNFFMNKNKRIEKEVDLGMDESSDMQIEEPVDIDIDSADDSLVVGQHLDVVA